MLYNIPDDTSKIKTYVGEDGNLHFIDWTGADSVLPFSSKFSFNFRLQIMVKYTLYTGWIAPQYGWSEAKAIIQYEYIDNVGTLTKISDTTGGATLNSYNAKIAINGISVQSFEIL